MTDDEDHDGPSGEPGAEPSHERWPIGFMLLVGAVALYLGWRLVQGVAALIAWITG